MAPRKPAKQPVKQSTKQPAKQKETLMGQYLQVKQDHPEGILFFQCGDFYEMFFDDARRAAGLLDITLTARNKHAGEKIPMAGVPHHSARSYIAKLTELGEKVVVCDQVEDARLVRGKRVVKREVVRIVTPGVVLDDQVLDPKAAHYLAAVACGSPGQSAGKQASQKAGKQASQKASKPAGDDTAGLTYGLAYLDVSTGEFYATEVIGLEALIGELARVRPHEVLSAADALAGPLQILSNRHPDASYGAIAPHDHDRARTLLESALSDELGNLGLADKPMATRAAADVVAYARATQPAGNLPLARIAVYRSGQSVMLDETAVANLELIMTLVGGKKSGSLLDVIDATRTAPGGRSLRRWLLYPLTDVAPIRRRQDAVEYFVERASLRAETRAELAQIHDLERLAGRISLGVATPRDLGRLRDSLAVLPALVQAIAGDSGQSIEVPEILRIPRESLATLAGIETRLRTALEDELGGLLRDGGFIRADYCAIVDEQRGLANGGKERILAIEARERERTDIPSLKVKYNKVFGYFIEITKTHLDRVPEDYVRKQTVANSERYMTEELSTLEGEIAAAQEILLDREIELFGLLCDELLEHMGEIAEVGRTIAAIDCCAALAHVAHTHDYVRPLVDDSEVLDIVGGRHPVVERVVPRGMFVPNDCRLDPGDEQILLITGPNMAGKSTFMRQVAQIALLAQMGSFVPAERAHVGLVDRIFTRVGAADNLARGESTFMVEMRETAAILRHATRRSLVVLDEVGRGTSTFDGVSIAWAVTEYLHDAIGARTLFATHYHELCMLSETRPRVRNVSVAVKEHRGAIVMLRQVVAGGSSRSYGIDVARLAGLPRSVITRGRQILTKLEGGAQLGQSNQLSLFSAVIDPGATPVPPAPTTVAAPGPTAPASDHPAVRKLLDSLGDLDPNHMTPLEALTTLADLCMQAKQVVAPGTEPAE